MPALRVSAPSRPLLKTRLGVLGGSGLYNLALTSSHRETVQTPWGDPSGELCFGLLEGTEVVFLARHGSGHRLCPSSINYRANVYALKQAGVSDLLSVSACGSLQKSLSPGTFVIVDQFIDRTRGRGSSFFGKGFVAHVSMAEPVSARLSGLAYDACVREGIPSQKGGIYLAMEGPQFSSRAESELYRRWGCDVLGMTNMPEAKLAREAEIPYASVAMVTDYDCWRQTPVVVKDVVETLKNNATAAARVVSRVAAALNKERPSEPADTVLDVSVVTDPKNWEITEKAGSDYRAAKG